jgi:hypothetical protein
MISWPDSVCKKLFRRYCLAAQIFLLICMARQGKIVLFAYGVLIAVDYFISPETHGGFHGCHPKMMTMLL